MKLLGIFILCFALALALAKGDLAEAEKKNSVRGRAVSNKGSALKDWKSIQEERLRLREERRRKEHERRREERERKREERERKREERERKRAERESAKAEAKHEKEDDSTNREPSKGTDTGHLSSAEGGYGNPPIQATPPPSTQMTKPVVAALDSQKRVLPTKSEVRAIRKRLRNIIMSAPCDTGDSGSHEAIRKRNCPNGDVIGEILRLAFHDVVAHNGKGGGGANGCMDNMDLEGTDDNMKDGSHNGLQDVVTYLDEILTDFAGHVSKADLWQFAAHVAIALSVPKHNTWRLKFRWGRVDADSCQDEPNNSLPNPELGCKAAFKVFERVGFTQEEMVILMGAHTAGKSEQQFSGYHGRWVKSFGEFDGSRFYKDILDVPWVQTNRMVGSNSKTQWMTPGNMNVDQDPDDITMMLNTDICLAFDFEGNANECVAGGRESTCPTSKHHDLVKSFSEDNQKWLDAFAVAFDKSMHIGVDRSTTVAWGKLEEGEE